MKAFYFLLAIFVAVKAEDFCRHDAISGCAGRGNGMYIRINFHKKLFVQLGLKCLIDVEEKKN